MDFVPDNELSKYSEASVKNADLDVMNAIKKAYTDNETYIFFRLRKVYTGEDKLIGSVFGIAAGDKELFKDLMKCLMHKDAELRRIIESALFEILEEEINNSK